MPEERSVTARADQNLRYRGAGSQSPILTTIIPFAFTQFTHLFPAQYHDNSGHTTRMPVTTRSTTRKTRSAAVCAKPPPPEGAAQGTSKPSSKTTSKPSFSKRKYTKSLSKVAGQGKSKPSSRTTSKPTSIGKRTKTGPEDMPRAAIKQSCKVANVEVAVAAPETGEVERAERMVSMMYLLSLTVPHTSYGTLFSVWSGTRSSKNARL